MFFFQEWQERKDHLLKNKDILYKTIRPTFSDIDMERLEKKTFGGLSDQLLLKRR